MKSENKNYIYNVIYQIFIFIIPLVTTPYISRVLGVSNIGMYSYTYSIVYYFMLATMLGINNFGSRSIARVHDNNEERSKVFSSIYYLQLTLGIIMLVIYNLLVIFCFKEHKEISLVQNIFLISAVIDINWLYFGLEKFKITISRNMIIKILSLVLVFLFVKEKDDLIIYTFIMSFSTFLSQLYLWLFLRKQVKFVKVPVSKIIDNFKKCIVLFIPVIAYSIYRVMDKTMLGKMAGTVALGLYENAEKIINIPVSFITALGTVMLPNMSKVKNDDEFKEKIYSSFKLCFFMIVPMAFGLLAVSDNFSIIFFGEEFAKSGVIIKLLVPSFVCSSIANVIRTNYLIPKEKDSIYVTSTIMGALINLVLNLILIPRFSYLGACIGTIAAEFTVMIYQAIKVRKFISFKKVFGIFFGFFLKGIIIFLVIILLDYVIKSRVLKLVLQILAALLIYVILNYKYILYEFFGKNKNH